MINIFQFCKYRQYNISLTVEKKYMFLMWWWWLLLLFLFLFVCFMSVYSFRLTKSVNNRVTRFSTILYIIPK